MHTGCSRNGACCAILQFLEGEKREKRVPLTLQDMLLQARVLMDRRQGRLPLPLLHPVLLTLLVLPPLPYQHTPLLPPPPLLVWLVVKTFFFSTLIGPPLPKIEINQVQYRWVFVLLLPIAIIVRRHQGCLPPSRLRAHEHTCGQLRFLHAA